MRRRISLLAIGILGLGWGGMTNGAAQSKALQPGAYALSMTASEGSRKGGVVGGELVLVAATLNDKSSRTGERAKDPGGWARPQFYGWTTIDFRGVGAPVCADPPNPSPSSRDPVYPGVLVISVPYGPKGPFSGYGPKSPISGKDVVPTLLIGTVTNLRTGQNISDGCGIAMYVLAWDGQCHAGKWSEWGLRVNGRGEFRLCPS
jgi:hypothetical protein